MKRNGNFSNKQDFNRFGFQNRKMYKAVCSDCGKECEVPFKPTEGRPVFCRDCFMKRRRY